VSGPSQPKVEDEQWSDERIHDFLALKPINGSNDDYHVLIQSYLHMTPDFFKRLIDMFVAEGRDLNALSVAGETILDHVSQHVRATEYIKVLADNGAVCSSK